MKKLHNVGIIGFGTIGSGVYELLNRNTEIISQRTGLDIKIKTICDLDIKKLPGKNKGIKITRDWRDVVSDDEIETVVEVIGGIEPAKTIIMEAMKKGKKVVTANKKLLAEQGGDIFALQYENNAMLGFEASVGGGIPCILSLRNGLVGNRILSVMGILNGTTNYILTRMRDDGLSIKEALSEAQRFGFAEADPSFDIEGFDAGDKIAILSMLAYNKKIDYNAISIEGISKISELDIRYAKEMGYSIKLLGISKIIDGVLDIRIHPTMLSRLHPLALVRNEFNAIMFETDMAGPVLLHGKGAGSLPTASAIISDIVQIAQKAPAGENNVTPFEEADYMLPENRLSRYYMRLHTQDGPGILSKISGMLGSNNISIASVMQKESNTTHVPLIIMTHKVTEANMLKAVKEINKFEFINGKVILIRVEDYSS